MGLVPGGNPPLTSQAFPLGAPWLFLGCPCGRSKISQNLPPSKCPPKSQKFAPGCLGYIIRTACTREHDFRGSGLSKSTNFSMFVPLIFRVRSGTPSWTSFWSRLCRFDTQPADFGVPSGPHWAPKGTPKGPPGGQKSSKKHTWSLLLVLPVPDWCP